MDVGCGLKHEQRQSDNSIKWKTVAHMYTPGKKNACRHQWKRVKGCMSHYGTSWYNPMRPIFLFSLGILTIEMKGEIRFSCKDLN